MRIIYTEHLKRRIKFRNIPYDLPRRAIKTSKEKYYDTRTRHFIVLKEARYAGKKRWMVVVYDRISKGRIEVITIHPIDYKLVSNRIGSGRWKKV